MTLLQVLEEEYQVLPNGTQRQHHLPLSEKLKRGETWQQAVDRAVQEELGSVLGKEYQVRRQLENVGCQMQLQSCYTPGQCFAIGSCLAVYWLRICYTHDTDQHQPQ